MKAPAYFYSLLMLFLVWETPSCAQFYPDSSANWCLEQLGPPPPAPELNCQFNMPNSPDTIINGVQYKQINRNQDATLSLGIEHSFVRSTPNGDGLIYIPELDAEFLTGSINVQVDDTVHNVIIADKTYTCEQTLIILPFTSFQLALADVVVQSIDTLTNVGVTVVRYTIIPLCPGASHPRFWQAGIGTEFGPILVLSEGPEANYLLCANAGEVPYYYLNSEPNGMPGVPCFCQAPVPIGVHEFTDWSILLVSPNPSTGHFTLSRPSSSTSVYTSTGRLLFETTGPHIDLSTYPPGLYHAVVRTGQGVGHLRLMVQR